MGRARGMRGVLATVARLGPTHRGRRDDCGSSMPRACWSLVVVPATVAAGVQRVGHQKLARRTITPQEGVDE